MKIKVSQEPDGNGLGGVQAVCRNIEKYSSHLFSSKNPDVYHSHALSSQKFTDVHTCHGIYLHEAWDEKFKKNTNQKIRQCLRNARFETVVAKWAKEVIEDMWPEINMIHIPNGYDREYLLEKSSSWGHINSSKEKVLAACGWNPDKNPSDIWTLARIMPEIEFLVLTDNVPPDFQNIPNNLTVSSMVPHGQLLHMIKEAKCVISPYELENCPGIVLESIGLRTPVLGAKPKTNKLGIGGNAELLNNTVGRLYTVHDVEEMRHELGTLLNTEYVEESFEEYDRKYYWGDIVKQYDELYLESTKDLDVSVYVMAYNEHDFLERSLSSIRPQVQVVVADASGNHGYLIPDKPNIKYIKLPNKNLSDNRQIAAEACDRKYICSLDADDVALNGKFTRYKFLEKNDNIAAVFSDASTMGDKYSEALNLGLEDGKIYNERDLLRSNLVASGSIMFRKQLLDSDQVNYGHGKYGFGEDYNMNIQCAGSLDGILHIAGPVYYYDTSKNRATKDSYKKDDRGDIIKMIKDNMKKYKIPEIHNVAFGHLEVEIEEEKPPKK